MTRAVRVRQHDDGRWYPEIFDPSGWYTPYPRKSYSTRGRAVNYFYAHHFEPTYALGKTYPPLYKWAEGEEPPKKKKPKKKDILDRKNEDLVARWGCCKVVEAKYG
jgi:hypothetical protein